MWALTVEDTHYVGTHSGGHPLCGHSQWRTPILASTLPILGSESLIIVEIQLLLLD